jgi:hypothetical protein
MIFLLISETKRKMVRIKENEKKKKRKKEEKECGGVLNFNELY